MSKSTTLIITAFVVSSCGSDGSSGPSGSPPTDFSGVWSGEIRNTVDSCDPEREGRSMIGEMRISRAGASNTFQFLDVSASGSISDSGAIVVSGVTEIDGISHEVSLSGNITGGRLQATHNRVRMEGNACAVTYVFDLMRV